MRIRHIMLAGGGPVQHVRHRRLHQHNGADGEQQHDAPAVQPISRDADGRGALEEGGRVWQAAQPVRLSDPTAARLCEAIGKFIEDATKNGNIVTGAGLQPLSAGARVGRSGSRIMMTDGPFIETKELIGGYAIVDAKTRDEALTLAQPRS